MNEKGKQTYFLLGKNSSIFREVDKIYIEQENRIKGFIEGKIKPTNDLWLAALSNMLGKISSSVENNDSKKIRELLIKFIAQLIVWVDLIEENAFEEVDIEEDLVQNPIYNTIIIKLIGEVSKLILQKRESTEIINQLVIVNSYCTYWKERLKSKHDTKISLKNFQKIDENFLEEIDDYFANIEINSGNIV
ncbi:MAG TPA: hypothetical protein VMX55_02425 [candidate division Zixibacteria bacterium]|nr:hypothetical protein [candidate division Zixibacteria bacterium]